MVSGAVAGFVDPLSSIIIGFVNRLRCRRIFATTAVNDMATFSSSQFNCSPPLLLFLMPSMSFVLAKLTDATVGLRVSEEEVSVFSQHGEDAYS